MYYIVAQMDLESPSIRHALSDVQDLHRNIQALFDKKRSESKALFRVEGNQIFISSEKKPVIQAKNGIKIKSIREMEPVKKGQVYVFNILTQPYKKHNSKRIPLKDKNKRIDWLNEKISEKGVFITEIREQGNRTIKSKIKSSNNKRDNFVLKAYQYFGVLVVMDAELFQNALRDGFGASKAYGLGLLTLVPVPIYEH